MRKKGVSERGAMKTAAFTLLMKMIPMIIPNAWVVDESMMQMRENMRNRLLSLIWPVVYQTMEEKMQGIVIWNGNSANSSAK